MLLFLQVFQSSDQHRLFPLLFSPPSSAFLLMSTYGMAGQFCRTSVPQSPLRVNLSLVYFPRVIPSHQKSVVAKSKNPGSAVSSRWPVAPRIYLAAAGPPFRSPAPPSTPAVPPLRRFSAKNANIALVYDNIITLLLLLLL